MMVGAIRSVQLTAHRAGVWVAVIPASSGPTGIDEIKTTGKADPYYYDLQGRRVESPSRGIYIHQGHKVVVR